MNAATAIRQRAAAPSSRRTPEGKATGTLPRTLKARSRPGDTALQRHASFFDDNGDRMVDVAECVRGLKALGLPLGVVEAAALAIVAPLSVQTRGLSWTLRIDVDRIENGRHDSDTRILDARGRFNARRFERIFGAHGALDRNGDRAFTATELCRMIRANRETLLGSWVATAEWLVLLAIAADTHAIESAVAVPAISVARLRSFYNGTLFYELAQARVRAAQADGQGGHAVRPTAAARHSRGRRTKGDAS